MKKAALCIVLAICIQTSFAQKTSPSLTLKAYQQSYISGVSPSPTVEIGGKEINTTSTVNEPTYFIYLLTHKVPYLRIERIWIKNQLYAATINKINEKLVVFTNGKIKDTLIKYKDEMIWQIKIKGKDTTGKTPKKDIKAQVKANELVLRLKDNKGHIFTRVAKQFTVLEAERGQ
jgi:hypothetical protein